LQSEFIILFIGDIVGKPGRRILSERLKQLKEKLSIDFVIANGENAAGGFGLTVKSAKKIFRYGVDVITSGNHIIDRKEEIDSVLQLDNVLRPANYIGVPGKGYTIVEKNSVKIGVVNAEGKIFMPEEPKKENPYNVVSKIITQIKRETPIIIVDFHAEATAEKIAMGWVLDGEVSAVVGTHTHVQTADEKILPKKTLYITDVGMTGPFKSVIGMTINSVVNKMKGQNQERLALAKEDVRINAVLLGIDKKSGKGKFIKRLEISEDSEG